MTAINARSVERQLRNFDRVLQAYEPHEPFARFLSRFYKNNKQMGSSDRRMTSRLCYNYFRMGKAVPDMTARDRLTVAEFLCETESDLVSLHKPIWGTCLSLSIADKVDFLKNEVGFRLNDVFPFADYLSASIDFTALASAQLVQPDLFIRVKRGNSPRVESELSHYGIAFAQCGENAYRLANGTRLQDLRKIEGDYEVQDLSSQKTLDFIPVRKGEKWWDTCAASGGKSLMLLDKYPDINLLVSDIRLSILRNLDERFMKAKIRTPYRKKILDLTGDITAIMQNESFDGILLDAPCSGSGTWSRTSERIQQFHKEDIFMYADRQKDIASRILPYLKPGGVLVYLTCSVFKAENEDIISFLQKKHGLQVETMEMIKGYDKKADSMFAARLRKPD